jgi:hypothetical protein
VRGDSTDYIQHRDITPRRCRGVTRSSGRQRRPSGAEYELSIPVVSNLFQNGSDLKQPFVDVVQCPSQSHESGNEHTELPRSHGSLRWLLCHWHLGIPRRMRFLQAAMVLRHSDGCSQPSDTPGVTAGLLPLRIRECGLLNHTSRDQHHNTRDYSVKSDFHCDSPRNWAELNRRPLFLAESHFTDQTPLSAILVPCTAQSGGRSHAIS